jgi:malate dehydrogenase (oxaloacetate-decarboxylating)
MNQVLDMDQTLDVGVDGYALVTTTLLNKGTAFKEAERDQFGLHGPLPPHIGSLEDQSERRLGVLRGFAEDIQNYVFLRDLQDTNETLFYAVLTANR